MKKLKLFFFSVSPLFPRSVSRLATRGGRGYLRRCEAAALRHDEDRGEDSAGRGEVPRLVTHMQRREVRAIRALPYYPATAGSREAARVLRGPAAAPRRVRPTCDGWPGPAAAAVVVVVGPVVTTAGWALH